jgi:hypothetical protein
VHNTLITVRQRAAILLPRFGCNRLSPEGTLGGKLRYGLVTDTQILAAIRPPQR